MRIVVLGASGLLGREVFRELSTLDSEYLLGTSSRLTQGYIKFDVLADQISELVQEFEPTHIVNCIGLIPQKIPHASQSSYIQKMFAINSIFPRKLTKIATRSNARIIQIRTDCVYGGKLGNYSEGSLKLPTSIYGASKALGETKGLNQLEIRASIIGHSPQDSVSLFGWFRNLPKNSVISGYTNHFWNGITTSVFARISAGLIQNEISNPISTHLVPADSLTKYQMLLLFRDLLGRNDVEIIPLQPKPNVDRRLKTNNPEMNSYLWRLAGYSCVPDLKPLIEREILEQLSRN